MTSGLSLKMSEQTEDKSTEQLAEIAKNQALMVMCLQRIEQDPLTQGIRIPVIEQGPLTQGIRIPVSGMSDKEKNCRDLWPEYSNIEPDFCTVDW